MSTGADRKANALGPQAHLSDVSAAAEGSSLLSTIAPGTPTPLPVRSSSVMLFSRSEVRGIPQNSVIMTCSSTTLARVSAASPVISLDPTLRHGRGHTQQGYVEGSGKGFAMCVKAGHGRGQED